MKNAFRKMKNTAKKLFRIVKPKPIQKIRQCKIKERESSKIVMEKLRKAKKGEVISVVVGTQFTKFNQKAVLINGRFVEINEGKLNLLVNGKKTSAPLQDIWQVK